MTDLLRHSTRRCRAWLIALAAMLLVTSILEAGHSHGTLTPEDSHCVFCQHGFSLDKTLLKAADVLLPLLANAAISVSYQHIIALPHSYFTAIRAPPQDTLNP